MGHEEVGNLIRNLRFLSQRNQTLDDTDATFLTSFLPQNILQE
jgi:hypothetical protein